MPRTSQAAFFTVVLPSAENTKIVQRKESMKPLRHSPRVSSCRTVVPLISYQGPSGLESLGPLYGSCYGPRATS